MLKVFTAAANDRTRRLFLNELKILLLRTSLQRGSVSRTMIDCRLSGKVERPSRKYLVVGKWLSIFGMRRQRSRVGASLGPVDGSSSCPEEVRHGRGKR